MGTPESITFALATKFRTISLILTLVGDVIVVELLDLLLGGLLVEVRARCEVEGVRRCATQDGKSRGIRVTDDAEVDGIRAEVAIQCKGRLCQLGKATRVVRLTLRGLAEGVSQCCLRVDQTYPFHL